MAHLEIEGCNYKMEWLAEWLAKRYARLYYHFGREPFEFEAAQEILGCTKRETDRTLREFQDDGFLYKSRLPTDLRRRQYFLVDPIQAVRAFALHLEARDTEDKLRHASGGFSYVVTGAAAAYERHGYLTPAKTDILIFKKDLGFWVGLLKERYIQIAVDEIPAEKRGPVIHLHTALTEETFTRAVRIEGVYYTSAEDLVLVSLRDPSDVSLLDAVALMLRCYKDLDWGLLSKSDVKQEIGFAMEVLNEEAGHEIFPPSLVQKFAEKDRVFKRFSTGTELLEQPEKYRALAKRWSLEVNVPPGIFQKVTSELASEPLGPS
jgi:DNA-binding MarR family transcriptional regulator